MVIEKGQKQFEGYQLEQLPPDMEALPNQVSNQDMEART